MTTTPKELYNKIDPFVVERIRSIISNTSLASTTGTGTDSEAVAAIRDAALLTVGNTASLNAERALTATGALSFTDGGANGNYTLALAMPGALSVDSASDASTNHTHAITASDDPGATAALLKSTSAGGLTLVTATATTSVTTPLITTAAGGLTLTPYDGTATLNGSLSAQSGTAAAVSITTAATSAVSTLALYRGRGTIGSPGPVEIGDALGLLTFGGYHSGGAYSVVSAQILATATENHTSGARGGALAVFTATTGTASPTERQRWHGSGNVTVGTSTDGGYKFDVSGTMRATTSVTTAEVITPLITTASNVDLVINPAGTGAVQFPNDQTLRTADFNGFSTPIEGWQINEVEGITGYSVLTIGKIQADELAVRVFVADEVRVDRGDEYWTKSYGIVAETFTTPSAIDGTVSVMFEDSPALTGAIFSNNDWVLFRKLEIDSGLTLFNVWGQVSSYVNNSDGTQNWTFTLKVGPTNEEITKGSLAIDFGATGAALIHLSVIDAAGAPYIKMRKWVTNPYSPSNYTTYVQLGNLGSIGNTYYTPAGYGIYIRSTAAEGQFIVADDNGLQLRGASLTLWDGATQTVNIDDEGTDIWIGQGSGDKLLAWNGSALSLRSNNTDVITLDTSGNSYFAGVMTIGTSGEIRQGTGTLGSNYTGLRIWRDSSVGRIAGYNSDIVQWYAGTDGRLYAGAGSVQIHSAGIDIQQDGYITPDAARSISWWEDIGSTSGTPTQTIKAFYNALGENVLSLEAMPQGGFYTDSRVDLVADAVSVTWYSSGILEVGGSITLSGTVDGVDIAAFKTAYDSHNHSGVYLPLSGGTITGTVTARDITFSADNTYDIGASDKRVQDLYVVNLRADNILGTPTFGHSHDSDYVNVDGDTMTNQLTMAFDNHQMIILDRTANANVDSTFFVGVSYVTGVSDDFAFFGKTDALQVFNDNTVKIGGNTVWHAGNDGAGSGLDADTLDGISSAGYMLAGSAVAALTAGTAISITGTLANYTIAHADTSTVGDTANSGGTVMQNFTFDGFGHVATQSSVNLDTRYAQALTQGSGISITGALSGYTIAHSDTSGVTSADNSGTTFIQDLTFDTYGHVTAIASVDAATALDSRYVNTTGDTMTGNLVVDIDAIGTSGYIGLKTNASLNHQWQFFATAHDYAVIPEDFFLAYYNGSTLATAIWIENSTMAAQFGGTLSSTNWNITTAGVMSMAVNSDTTHTLGRAVIGYSAASDSATFAHYDQNTSTNFGFAQYANGASQVNATTGQEITLSVNDVATYTVNADRLLPRSSVQVDLGDYNRKIRTIHAAELAVQTLIAQDVIATVGGQIIVSPTSRLIADISSAGVVGGTDVIYTNLISYWSLDEVGGTRLDSKSTNHLSDKNTVTSTTGKVGVSALFNLANSERLWCADNAALSTGDIQFYACAWVYATLDDGGTQCVLAKAGASGDRSWTLQVNWSTNKFDFTVYSAANAATTISTGTISTNTWYFVECWHDSSGNTINIALNRTETSSAYSAGVKDDTGNFTIGARSTGVYFTGRVDEVGFWKNYIPNSTRRNWLYNSGSGRAYTDIYNYGAGAFEMDIEHNSYGAGDFLYMAAAPGGIAQHEVFKITSAPTTITGGYRYSAERDLDGTGANNWYAGDAVTSLGGAIGEGYINLTATSTVHGHFGPTIAHYVRRGTGAWDSIVPVVVSGNLRSFLDYNADEFGHAAGNDLLLTPAEGFQGYSIDTANGFRAFNLDIALYDEDVEFLKLGTISGLRIETNDLSDSDNRGIAFTNSGNEVADMRSYFAPAQSYYQLRSSSPAGMSANLNLFALSPSDRSASVTMSAIRSGGSSASVSVLDATISANSEVTLYTSGTIELNATLIAANADIDMNGNDIIDIGTLGETWTSLSFNTGWGNYGGGFHAMKYKKAGDLVFLRGLVVRTSGSSATIATLPSGYRPPSELMLATSSAGAFGIVQITTAGVINVTVGMPTGWVSLDNIVFSTLA